MTFLIVVQEAMLFGRFDFVRVGHEDLRRSWWVMSYTESIVQKWTNLEIYEERNVLGWEETRTRKF